MADDLASFAVWLGAEVKAVEGVMIGDVRQVMRSGQGKFAHRTPVRSGRARSSVHPYRGQPDTDYPGPDQTFYPIVGDDRVDAVMAGYKLGEEVGLVTNLPYFPRLANGWSQQQPAGWVDTIIEELATEAPRE